MKRREHSQSADRRMRMPPAEITSICQMAERSADCFEFRIRQLAEIVFIYNSTPSTKEPRLGLLLHSTPRNEFLGGPGFELSQKKALLLAQQKMIWFFADTKNN